MATKEDVEAFNKQYGTPWSGGVNIYQDGQKIDNLSYEKFNELGGRLPGVTTDPDTIAKRTQNLFLIDGEYTIEPKTKVTLDPIKRELNILGPSEVVNSSEFRERTDYLTSYLSAYKQDPSVQFAKLDANGGETGETYTMEDMVAELNEPVEIEGSEEKISPIQQLANYQINLNRNKTMFGKLYQQVNEDGTISPVTFTEANIRRAYANGTTYNESGELVADPTANDDTLIALPRGWDEFKDIYKSEFWDDENGVISQAKFKEIFYDREKTSDENILRLYMKLEDALGKYAKMPVDYQNVDADQYAGIYALYQYMGTHNPLCSFWQGTGDVMAAVGNAIVDTGLSFGKLLGTGAAWIEKTIFDFERGIVEKIGADNIKIIDEFMTLRYPEWLENYNPEENGPVHATWEALGSAQNTFQMMRKMGYTAFDLNDDEKVQQAFQHQQTQYALNSAAENVEAVGEWLLQTAAFISMGNLVANAAGGALAAIGTAAKSTALSVEILGKGLATGESLSGGMRTMISLLGTDATAGVFNAIAGAASSKVGGWAISVAAETFGEALLQSPEVLAEILATDKLDSEGKSYLWGTYIGNVISGAVVVVGGKALYGIGQTTWGKAATANVRRMIFKAQGAVGDAIDALHIKFSKYESVDEWLKSVPNAEKQQAATIKRILRAKKEEIANSTEWIKVVGKDKDDILKALDEVDVKLDELMKLENALDDLSRGGTLKIAEWRYSDDNPAFKAVNAKLSTLTGDILKLEREAGLESAARVSSGALFSQSTTNYIGASVRVPILENVIRGLADDASESAKKAVKAATEELGFWRTVMSGYENTVSPELLNTVQNYVSHYKNWWKQANNLYMREGLMDAADLASYRANHVWGHDGELYARLQRKQEMSDYFVMRRDGKLTKETVRDLGHYQYGDTTDFVDPTLVMEDELRRQADAALRQEVVKNFYGNAGATVRATAEEMRVAKQIKPLLNSYNKAVTSKAGELGELLENEGFFRDAVAKSQLQADATTAQRIANTRPLSNGQRQFTVAMMFDEEVDGYFNLVYGGRSANEVLEATPTLRGAIGDISNETELRRYILSTDDAARNHPEFNRKLTDAYHNFTESNMEVANREAVAKAENLSKKLGMADKQLQSTARQITSDLKDGILVDGSEAARVSKEISRAYGGLYPDTVNEYLAWDGLYKNRSSIKKQVQDRAFEYYKKAEIGGRQLTAQEAERASKEVAGLIDDNIVAGRNQARAMMNQMGGTSTAIIDSGEWQKEVYTEADKIAGLKKQTNIIAIQNPSGATELVEVDPLIAEFVTSKPGGQSMGSFGKANYLWMKLFRMGTTGINPTSMVNQEFRDLGNAWIMGNVTATLTNSQQQVAEIFGDNFAKFFSQYSPEAQENFLQQAAKQGRSVEEVVAEAEIAGRGTRVATSNTETEAYRLYKQTRDMWYEGGVTKTTNFDRLSESIDKITDKLGIINEKREQYLRKLVYGNNFADAVKNGKSISQARTFAEYISNNATTNFTRATTFLSSIQNSIPYLRSAINGTKSFWRLWSIDPVGVTGRLLGGFGIPVLALTAMSLSSEENRAAYKNIKEYTKESALPLVMNGEVFLIPLPQELAPFLNPIRQAVENTFGVGTGAGLELVVNDILDLSPLDFGGFTDLDQWRLYGEGLDWGERLTQGSAQLFSQTAPKWAVAAATAASGRDLYTGKKIDTSYVTVDPDTGEIKVVSYTEGVLANTLHDIFPDLPAAIAQEVLETLGGVATVQVLDFLIDSAESVWRGTVEGQGFEAIAGMVTRNAEVLAEDIVKPVHPYVEDVVEREWRSQIGALWEEKKQLLAGDAWQSYLTNKRNAVSQTQIDAAATARANILDPFYEKVMKVTKGLIQQSGNYFNDIKFGSLVSLMNLDMTTVDGNAAIDDLTGQTYTQAKRMAVSTMERLGFPSVGTSSLLGTLRQAQDGSTYVAYNTPLQILNMQYTSYSQGAMHAAQIKSIIQEAGLDNMDDVWAKIKSAKSTTEKDKIKAEWDVKVGVALAPYIRQYGANAITSATAVTDYLDSILLVPNSYTKNGRKSTYHENLDQQRGFAKQFIKDIFGGIDQ